MEFAPGIIYEVTPPSIREDVLSKMHAEGYRLKNEFHVTVVDADLRASLLPEQVESVTHLLHENAPYEITFSDTLYSISRPKVVEGTSYQRESLVVPVMSTGLIALLGSVATEYKIELPQPFLHVTVATRPDTEVGRRGIGITSLKEWQGLKPVEYCADWKVAS